jgi:hypothetical protein
MLMPVPTRGNALEVKLQTRSNITGDNSSSETELLPGSPVLVFGSVHFRFVPITDFMLLPIPTSPLEVMESAEGAHQGGVLESGS